MKEQLLLSVCSEGRRDALFQNGMMCTAVFGCGGLWKESVLKCNESERRRKEIEKEQNSNIRLLKNRG